MRFLALLAPLLLLSSCLLQKVLVAQLDTIIEYRLSSTLQLYVKQDRVLEQDVASFLNAQRALAPQLEQLLKSANVDRPNDIPQFLEAVLTVYRAIESDFRKVLVKHLLTLDKEQRKTFYAKLKEMNEESYEKLKKDRTEEYHDRMEFFIGELTKTQEKMLRPYEAVFLERDRQRLLRREGFQADMKRILESESPTREQELLERFLRQQRESFSDVKHLEAFLKELLLSLTKEQREHLEEKRREFINMVKQFAGTTYS